MYIGEKIKVLRKERKMTQEQLATSLGLKSAAISKYEKGIVSPSWANIVKIAAVFNISSSELIEGVDLWFDPAPVESTLWEAEFEHKLNKMGYRIIITEAHEEEYMFLEYPDGSLEISPDDIIELNESATEYLKFKLYELKNKRIKDFKCNKSKSSHTIKIKHSVYKASAGFGFDLEDRDEWDEIDIPDTPEAHNADFAVTIFGNSMEPIYHDSDIVLVKIQDRVNIGETGIFIVNGQGFIKQYGGDRLISVNSDYEDIVFSEGDFIKCAGKVIGTVKAS